MVEGDREWAINELCGVDKILLYSGFFRGWCTSNEGVEMQVFVVSLSICLMIIAVYDMYLIKNRKWGENE